MVSLSQSSLLLVLFFFYLPHACSVTTIGSKKLIKTSATTSSSKQLTKTTTTTVASPTPGSVNVATTTPNEKVCKKDPKGSDFIPNIYICNNTQSCCTNAGQFSCCSNEVTTDAIKEQVIMWSVLIGILLLVGFGASCYFKDRYCCDKDPDEEDKHVCCCCCRRKIHYRRRTSFQSIFYPDHSNKNKVDDPIFGPVGQADDVPNYATVDRDIEAKYITRE